MGVSVRVSRNTRIYVPFWVAIPVWLIVAAGWLVAMAATLLWSLLFALPAKGIARWQDSRSAGREARQERTERRQEAFRARRERSAAEREAARQAHTERQEAARQTRAAAREQARQARSERTGARREAASQLAAERKSRRAARPPLGWPGWGNISAGAAFLTGIVLAGVAGSNAKSPLAVVGALLVVVSAGMAAVCVPVALWRKFQARKRARAGSPEQ